MAPTSRLALPPMTPSDIPSTMPLPVKRNSSVSSDSSDTSISMPSIVVSDGTSDRTVHTPTSSSRVASSYRNRYAQYLAATFGISYEAALSDMESQLAPRKKSQVTEAELEENRSVA